MLSKCFCHPSLTARGRVESTGDYWRAFVSFVLVIYLISRMARSMKAAGVFRRYADILASGRRRKSIIAVWLVGRDGRLSGRTQQLALLLSSSVCIYLS